VHYCISDKDVKHFKGGILKDIFPTVLWEGWHDDSLMNRKQNISTSLKKSQKRPAQEMQKQQNLAQQVDLDLKGRNCNQETEFILMRCYNDNTIRGLIQPNGPS
jgi:hypothetical protein